MFQRIGFIPHDQDREDQRAEEKAERRAMNKIEIEVDEPDTRFGFLDPEDDEFASVDTFAEYLYEDERDTYTCHELQCLHYRTNLRIADIKATLAGYGLTLERRAKERTFRGFSSWDHNRWQEPC